MFKSLKKKIKKLKKKIVKSVQKVSLADKVFKAVAGKKKVDKLLDKGLTLEDTLADPAGGGGSDNAGLIYALGGSKASKVYDTTTTAVGSVYAGGVLGGAISAGINAPAGGLASSALNTVLGGATGTNMQNQGGNDWLSGLGNILGQASQIYGQISNNGDSGGGGSYAPQAVAAPSGSSLDSKTVMLIGAGLVAVLLLRKG